MRRERNAAEFTFWLVIGILCTPNALGVVPLPRSLAEGPWFLARCSVVALWLGCFAAVAGILWRSRITGEAIQQVALVMIGFGGVFYAGALIAANTADLAKALLAVAFVSGVGLGALARYVQLRGWWPLAVAWLQLQRKRAARNIRRAARWLRTAVRWPRRRK